ncbi:ribonuclease Y [Cryptosporangium sp. NPDC051539]|uniref:ribonuclease Y n=1 Tax=Cryptosporangium sp. NPDC051539 TaxID=3363962 RepID=UPI0037967A4A
MAGDEGVGRVPPGAEADEGARGVDSIGGASPGSSPGSSPAAGAGIQADGGLASADSTTPDGGSGPASGPGVSGNRTAAPAVHVVVPRQAADAFDPQGTETARSQADRVVEAAQEEATEIVARARRRAEREAEDLLADARRAAEREVASLRAEVTARRDEAQRRETRVTEREERATRSEGRLAERETELTALADDLATQQESLVGKADEHRVELERIAGLSADSAKTQLIKEVETQAKREAAILVRDIEAEARAKGEERAKRIVVDAIQRVASEQTAESVVSVLHLPGDDMKGRIIGREGRNIRTFESVTGVNLIIDDTPEAVLLSCFDPVRREVGRLTLEKLVLDGRIHPQRIEEVYERAREQVEELCVRAGEDALVQVGIADMHPELIATLGRLRYRTSYGQNVLKHLIETAHIASHMAAELRIDVELVKRSAFLHDIGKALTHEVEGSHALIGADLARRYGERDEVVHAIEAHHDEVAPRTLEAVLTQASDSCSGGRPGARRESLETYVKRLERIEEIASAMPGVEKVFAMQAGREVRVMVAPEQIDDLAAQILARDVAKQIEDELTYPGQIRITVVRESRATGIAH